MTLPHVQYILREKSHHKVRVKQEGTSQGDKAVLVSWELRGKYFFPVFLQVDLVLVNVSTGCALAQLFKNNRHSILIASYLKGMTTFPMSLNKNRMKK